MAGRGLHWIEPGTPDLRFPPVDQALREPEGLLAAGGDLRPERLVAAYRAGIFPWYEAGQPILWWSPDPRAVLPPERLHISRSLRKRLRHAGFSISFDRAFEAVLRGCAAPRRHACGTWITPEMHAAYLRLFELGLAHSVEVWQKGRLVGGLYGVAIGRIFFGESMFSRVSDASKVALVYLARHLQAWDFPLIDCQLPNPHLERMGAVCIPREQFTALLREYCAAEPKPAPWTVDPLLDVTEWDPSAGGPSRPADAGSPAAPRPTPGRKQTAP